MSSDAFLAGLQDALARPDSSAPAGPSYAGMSMTEGSQSSIKLHDASSIPPGLAEHSDYEILRELGRGGMGVVYLAWNRLMGRKEVLKVVSRELIDRRRVLERFLREIRNAAQLHHPNIVTAYSAIRAGQSIVFAMEYVEGDDLAQLVNANGPPSVEDACNFIYQAALGLQYAHEKGLVHRDIKPSNLILSRQDKRPMVKVLDFGLAKATREGHVEVGLTHEGQMLGTPDYIAPEQSLDAQKADIRADIYSLGCTLYYLLSGGAPFQAASLYELLQAHHSMEARPLNLVRPEVPRELAAVVAKMMAKEPARRFQTPGEVARVLTPFFKKGSVALQGTNSEISQVSQTDAPQSALSPVPVPAPPAVQRAPQPVSEARKPVPTEPDSVPKDLIELRQTDPQIDRVLDAPVRVAAPASSQRNLRPWSTAAKKLSRIRPRARWAAAGLLLLGFVAAGAAVVWRVKTANGTIVLENVPENAVVEVDGDRITVIPAIGEPVMIEAKAGKHVVVVKRGGDVLLGESVTLESGKQFKLAVRFERPARLTNEPPKSDGAESTGMAKNDSRPDAGAAVKTATSQESIKNSIGMTLMLIPAGEFFMGSPDDATEAQQVEKPSHRVRITKPFYLGAHEVTQAEYQAVLAKNPSYLAPTGGGRDQVSGQASDQYPVGAVSWLDAVRYCNVLSGTEGKKPFYEFDGKDFRVPDWNGLGYRLPTEAEWEYACRANALTPARYSFGDDVTELAEYGWFDGNSSFRPHPVCHKKPNGFGLYDMHGNVAEWCWDWFGQDYYIQSAANDPTGPAGAAIARVRDRENAECRIFRGGGCNAGAGFNRSASRNWHVPGYRSNTVGFRLALTRSGR